MLEAAQSEDAARNARTLAKAMRMEVPTRCKCHFINAAQLGKAVDAFVGLG